MGTMTPEASCEWLHRQFQSLPRFKHPFQLRDLPKNGIYFFYEDGEVWGHGSNKPRIVRVGTHRQGNFRSRIADHFLVGRRVVFDRMKPAPKDRSIFRKNIGRALLGKAGSNYIDVWNKDFTSRKNRERWGRLRDPDFESRTESEITRLLKESFSFSCINVEDEKARMGTQGIESRLIGTLSRCDRCGPSDGWLGNHSPVGAIRYSGLWLVQHLRSAGLDSKDRTMLTKLGA